MPETAYLTGNERSVAFNAALYGLGKRKPVATSEWAERGRILGESSARKGKWDNDQTPYLKEIMDAPNSDDVFCVGL